MPALRFIQSAALLVVADDLAGREAGPGAPRPMALRRAVSTAYYALFHKLGQHTAARLVGDGDWTRVHASVARWVTHTDLKALSDAANGRGNLALRTALGDVDTTLADVAQNFLDLQAARESADYDDFAQLSKKDALSYIDAARQSVTDAERLYRSTDASYHRFLGLAVGGVKIAKSR